MQFFLPRHGNNKWRYAAKTSSRHELIVGKNGGTRP